MERLKATIDRFEGDKAVLILADGQKIIVSKVYLPSECKEGDTLQMNFFSGGPRSRSNLVKAKKLLSKLLSHHTDEAA